MSWSVSTILEIINIRSKWLQQLFGYHRCRRRQPEEVSSINKCLQTIDITHTLMHDRELTQWKLTLQGNMQHWWAVQASFPPPGRW